MGFLSSIFPPSSGTGSDGTPAGVPPAPAPIAATPAPPAPAPTPAPGPGSSLDQFADLWSTPKDKDGKPIVHANPLATPIYNFDPKAIEASAGKIDFTANVDPTLAAKALGGDAAALAAFVNGAVRAAVIGVTTNQGALINGAMDANNQRLLSTLPTHVKRVQLDQQPMDNPILEHPSVAPLLQALKAAEFNKNPSADPAEVHKRVTDYIVGLGSALTENAQALTTKAAAKGEVNWLEWAKS